MTKQTKPIRKMCQSREACLQGATIGLYSWGHGQTDVNLDKPVRVFCGRHKPRLDRGQNLRNVKLVNHDGTEHYL
jgi:hypothetical protein